MVKYVLAKDESGVRFSYSAQNLKDNFKKLLKIMINFVIKFNFVKKVDKYVNYVDKRQKYLQK